MAAAASSPSPPSRALPPPWESCKVTAKAWVEGILSVSHCRMWWLPAMVNNMRHNRTLITCNDAVALPPTQLASLKVIIALPQTQLTLAFDPSLFLSLSLSRSPHTPTHPIWLLTVRYLAGMRLRRSSPVSVAAAASVRGSVLVPVHGSMRNGLRVSSSVRVRVSEEGFGGASGSGCGLVCWRPQHWPPSRLSCPLR